MGAAGFELFSTLVGTYVHMQAQATRESQLTN
jgi:hypothetical protein